MIHAAFLDRDGTRVEDPGFLRDPDDVRLLPGAVDAVRRLNRERIRAIVVTNQSGLARGFIEPGEYEAVTRRLEELLRRGGAMLDAVYHCPHYPPLSGPCDCRKPGTLLYRTAGAHFGLDLARCAWIGDRLTDLLPAHAFGGRGVLVRTGKGMEMEVEAEAAGAGFPAVDDLPAALAYLLGTTG